MRDELDGRMWVAHHENYGALVAAALATLRAGIRRLGGWDGSAAQLLAIVAAFALTDLSLAFTSSAT